MVAPDLFTLRDEDGHSEANDGGRIASGQEQAANSAISSCPERAIQMIEG